MSLSATKRINKDQSIAVSIEYRAAKMFWDKFSSLKGFQDNRQRPNIILKHSFSVACRSITGLSLAEVGSIIDKDHATILHSEKNHESNLMYLNGYKNVYNEVYQGLLKVLQYEDDVTSAEDCMTIKELRYRLISTSQKLREKIYEVNNLKQGYKIGLSEENEFLKKHAKQVHERNKKLEKELARVKNLL